MLLAEPELTDMYIPSAFAEQRLSVLHGLIRSYPFATVITTGNRGIIASHVPVVLLPTQGAAGSLQFHLAKPNPQCEDLAAGTDVLAIFQGPHGYVSPTWYVTAGTVPTWNYVAVHAYGKPSVMSDEGLAEHLDRLVAGYESGRANGWDTGRLSVETFSKLRGAIVGFDVAIARIEGKWKLGQNRTAADRAGAIAGLRTTGTPDNAALADWMAAAMEDGSGVSGPR
jgi:transcriptional regulator